MAITLRTVDVKKAIKNLIKDNESGLLLGLSMQGISRKIHSISTTTLTPLGGYYYIVIQVSDARGQSRSVKATTTEKLWFVGREEGVSAYSSVLIYK